jgi:uncharacterized protein (DUF2252 family)
MTQRANTSNAEVGTPQERAAIGKAARKASPRSSHGAWSVSQRTSDPLDLLIEQETTRVADLLPIRHGRMAASPFAYYRGAALPMAADLATMSRTGLNVQLCGDAHLSNFGAFGSPERDLLFDVNDFDETNPGPFEWDVKRLAASLVIAGRSRGFGASVNRDVVLRACRTYRDTVRRFAGMTKLDVWYAKLDAPTVYALWGAEASKGALKQFQQAAAKAQSKDQLKARKKLTQVVDGTLQFLSDPPLLVPARELFPEPEEAIELETLQHFVDTAIRSYRQSLASERRHLLDCYRPVDLARKVVGVGSVGTRCWVALFVGRDLDDSLFIQVKEAETSVLERFTAKSRATNHGQRVVEGQRLMQAASDILLGWERLKAPDGMTRDFYMRQLWDWKGSAEVDNMDPNLLTIYAGMCAWTLARAHARSGDPIAISAYLGTNDVFDQAVAEFATAYADQNDVDHQSLVTAIKDGRLVAELGI